ncbi:MAG: type II toxin-antitoxin system HicA family toxin [Phototrophicaceae bacterium]
MSDKLPVISGQACVRALQAAGFAVERQKGSHITLRRIESPHLMVVVPDHDELDRGTLRAIIHQAGLTPQSFKTYL